MDLTIHYRISDLRHPFCKHVLPQDQICSNESFVFTFQLILASPLEIKYWIPLLSKAFPVVSAYQLSYGM